jgi:hypothetical protein
VDHPVPPFNITVREIARAISEIATGTYWSFQAVDIADIAVISGIAVVNFS